MSTINIHPTDKLSRGQDVLRLMSSTAAGVSLARHSAIAGAELVEFFTHEQLRELIDSNTIRVDRRWYEEGRAKARLLAGVTSLNELPKAELEEVMRRNYYVDEFLKREANDKKVKRTDSSIKSTLATIDSDRPKDGARCDQARETHGTPSARTFRRWLAMYEDGGFDPLALRTRYRNSGNPFSSMHPEASRLLVKHAVSYADERRPTKALVYNQMKAEFIDVNADREAKGLEPITCPARTTLSKQIDALNAFEVFAARHGLSKARAKFAIVSTGLDVSRPLQVVQIDEWYIQLHTIAEKIGLGETLTEEERIDLKKQRLKLCVVLDIATRCVLAIRISDRTDAANAIAALAMAVSDKKELAKAAGCESTWPMGGAFAMISPDAGSAFIDGRFRACVADLKATYENAPAGLSHMRGHIERIFGSIHTGLMPTFTGRSFSNVVDKGEYKAADRAAIFSAQLPRIMVRWVVDVYHHTPHSGLSGETPFMAWERLTKRFGIDAPPSPDQRREIFGMDLERALDQRGVRVAGIHYQSAPLQDVRREVGDTVVKVRFDPSDIGRVSVWLGDAWQTVPAVRGIFNRVDLDTWYEAVRDLKRRHALGAKVHEHVALRAIQAIGAMARDAFSQTGIAATRPTVEQLDLEERHLLLGFDVVADDDIGSEGGDVDGSGLLGGGIPVASAQASHYEAPTPVQPSSSSIDDVGLED
jgi:putative transposase